MNSIFLKNGKMHKNFRRKKGTYEWWYFDAAFR
jgi:hypothetical protein